MREIHATFRGIDRRSVFRVLDVEHLASEWRPDLSWLVLAHTADDHAGVERLVRAGMTNLALATQSDAYQDCHVPLVCMAREMLEEGDVVAVNPSRRNVHVLFRESDAHHTVFLTSRCNSYCLMCSQPPTRHDDSWLVDEAIAVARHIRKSPEIVGFSGGEPLLLGARLRSVLDTFAALHPTCEFDVLTNGRLFSDPAIAASILTELRAPVTWMVPLYGHVDFLHDYVVQTYGAFDETIAGILRLQAAGQPIQLRVLPEFCTFIARNLPFVHEVAIMGCEPIGFALANREQCEVNIREWHPQLAEGIRNLERGRLRLVLMNLPLCALPRSCWRYALQSISDWKQVYAPECARCSVKHACAGLFAWHERGWRPTAIEPIGEVA